MHFSVLVAFNPEIEDGMSDVQKTVLIQNGIGEVLNKYSSDNVTFHSQKEEIEDKYNDACKNKKIFKFAKFPNGSISYINENDMFCLEYVVNNHIKYKPYMNIDGKVYELPKYRKHVGSIRNSVVRTKSSRKIKIIECTLPQLKFSLNDYAKKIELLDVNNDGDIGEYYNSDTQYDWYEVGGRWKDKFLVKKDVFDFVDPMLDIIKCIILDMEFSYNRRTVISEEYKYVDVARKSEILFDKQKELDIESIKEIFEILKTTINSNEYVSVNGFILKNGALYNDIISHCGTSKAKPVYKYTDSSSFEEFLNIVYSFCNSKYPVTFNSLVSNDYYWTSRDNGYSEDEWKAEIEKFIDSVPDNYYLATVDCHI